MKPQIGVIGYDEKVCTKVARNAALEVGRSIARAGAVLICGGLEGVMEAACIGAKEEGGLTVGIIPSDKKSDANRYCDVVISTGAGYVRNFFVAYSADALIVVGGGVGTLIELSAAYQKFRPIIAVKGTGGVADKLANRYVDGRKNVKVVAGRDATDSVRKALAAIGGSA